MCMYRDIWRVMLMGRPDIYIIMIKYLDYCCACTGTEGAHAWLRTFVDQWRWVSISVLVYVKARWGQCATFSLVLLPDLARGFMLSL